MAIAITRPIAGLASTTNASSYAMSAFTPSANSLLVCFVIASGTVAAAPTMTGGSLTWTRRLRVQNNIAGVGAVFAIFTAPVGGSPVSTTPTFDCTGDAATGCCMSLIQATGHNTALSNPLQQSYIDGGATTSTNAFATFASALNTNNGYFIGFQGTLTAPAATPPTNWTEADDLAFASPSVNLETAYRAGGETTTGPFTFTNNNTSWYSMGVEIIAKTDTNVATGKGDLTLTGFAPTVTAGGGGGVTVSTGLGQLTLTGFSPQVNLKINTDVGALVLTGFAPQVNQKINTGVGQLTLTGFAPTVSVSNNITVSTGTGVLTLTGFSPQVNQKINTNTGQLTINGFTPTILTPVTVNTGTGQLTLTGFAPNVGNPINVNTQTGILTLTGFAPSVQVSNNQTVSTDTGLLIITGFAPDVYSKIQTGTGELLLTGFSPTVTVSGVGPGLAETQTGQLVLTGFAPTITITITVILPAPIAVTVYENAPIKTDAELKGIIIVSHGLQSPTNNALSLKSTISDP